MDKRVSGYHWTVTVVMCTVCSIRPVVRHANVFQHKAQSLRYVKKRIYFSQYAIVVRLTDSYYQALFRRYTSKYKVIHFI